MYHTDLVLPEDLEKFDHNTLAKFEYYVFIIVSSPDDYRLALSKFGPLLASCDALCFLIDRDRFKLLAALDVLDSLFQLASAQAPSAAVSFIAAISKRTLADPVSSQGQWFELFLSLEGSQEDKEAKLRDGIHKALIAKPRSFSEYSPIVAKVFEGAARLLLRAHG